MNVFCYQLHNLFSFETSFCTTHIKSNAMRSISHLFSFANAAKAPLNSLSLFPCLPTTLPLAPLRNHMPHTHTHTPHARSEYVGRTIRVMRITKHGISSTPKIENFSEWIHLYRNFVINSIYLAQMYGQILPRNIISNTLLDFAVYFSAHCLCITIFSTVNAHGTPQKMN